MAALIGDIDAFDESLLSEAHDNCREIPFPQTKSGRGSVAQYVAVLNTVILALICLILYAIDLSVA